LYRALLFPYTTLFRSVIANYSNDPASHSGWGGTFQFVQRVLGGDNKLAVQYGRGGGTGFGTLARFYYPDFSVRHDLTESRFRARSEEHTSELQSPCNL